MRQQSVGRLIGTTQGNGHAAAGQRRQNLMQHFLTGGVNVNHRLRIQHKPFEGSGGLREQSLYLFLENSGVGEI